MIIYKITNTKNGKVYIGQTINFEKRRATHKRNLRRGTHDNEHLQRAWNADGENVFTFEEIEKCSNREMLNEAETRLTLLYKSHDRNFGYNMLIGGIGYEFTSGVKEKISRAVRGNKNGFYGKQHSNKTKRHLSKLALQRPPMSNEVREKIRLAAVGKKHSIEWKHNISSALLGKKKSKEAVEKMRISLTGRSLSEDHKNKLRKSHVLNIKSPTGVHYKNVHGLKEFCRIHNLDSRNLMKVVREKTKSHRGWTLI